MNLTLDMAKEAMLQTYVEAMINVIDPEPMREGVVDTPMRAAKAWQHWTGGYDIDTALLLKTFEDGAENYDEMIVVSNIDFFSHCEHHLASIIGKATVAYIPNRKIVGLSKIPRVIDAYARRLQVQERMTSQIADCIWDNLEPKGVGVHLMARHLCLESRGIQAVGTVTHTTALRGAMREQDAARSEFLSCIDRKVTL